MKGTWTRRALTFGTTGLTAAITLLMVLAPAGGAVAPLKVYSPPYKGTASSPFGYSSYSGCGKVKATTAAWHPLTGVITTGSANSAKTCGKALGYVGGSSDASSSNGIQVAFPFSVGTNGNHSVWSSWTVNVASSWSYSASSVCSKNVNYNPPLYSSSYAYCQAGTYVSFQVSSYLQDLSNSSWYNYNYSSGYTYNDTYFENYTYCYNYGSPSCFNYTGGSFQGGFGYNEAGVSAWTWNGATTLTLWSNGTNMVKGHHYILIVDLYAAVDAFAVFTNLLSPWAGSATATVNLATLGNGATINSVSVV